MVRFRVLSCAALLGICEMSARASVHVKRVDEPAAAASRPPWILGGLMKLSQEQPRRLLRIAEGLFSAERIRMTQVEPTYAFEWQHRLAMVSALSQLFDPSKAQARTMGRQVAPMRQRARAVLVQALLQDPSLLVRDGAVESVRRIIRMRPAEGRYWKKQLETAFMDSKNHVEGEGLFIRETVLTALREASLRPSRTVWKAAERDQNPQVRELLRQWNTSAYDF